jgi:hypothetical protein
MPLISKVHTFPAELMLYVLFKKRTKNCGPAGLQLVEVGFKQNRLDPLVISTQILRQLDGLLRRHSRSLNLFKGGDGAFQTIPARIGESAIKVVGTEIYAN